MTDLVECLECRLCSNKCLFSIKSLNLEYIDKFKLCTMNSQLILDDVKSHNDHVIYATYPLSHEIGFQNKEMLDTIKRYYSDYEIKKSLKIDVDANYRELHSQLINELCSGYMQELCNL